MQKIGLLSDTHGTWDDKFAKYFEACDQIWHAGDIGDLDVLLRLRELAPVRAVYGNIDGQSIRQECPKEQIFDVNGCSVYMRHIVGYPGKYEFGIPSKLRAERPKITVGGHSHILRVQYDGTFDTLFINPGAAGHQGFHQVRTLIRFCIDDGLPKDLEVIELHK